MNVLSLFSGIGGIDLGLERAGMTVVGQVEIDPWCRKVLAKHWPEVPRHDDVRTAADWWGERPAPDLVCGGFPCQPVSLAGKGLAQADERWLWPAFAGIIRQLRPRYVLVENVPGLLGRGMGDVLGDLAELGYDAEWDCISAADVGAPHLRKRVWIVAYPAGIGRLGTDHDQREHAPPRRAGRPDPVDVRVAGQAGSEPRILADARSAGLAQQEGQPGDDGTQLQAAQRGRGDARELADTGRLGRRQGPRQLRWMGPAKRGWWSTEPDVGRVASRLSTGMDGTLNAHQECITQGRATGIPETDRLRALRDHIAATETPSRPQRCALCGHPLSAMPCRGACPPWHLGQRPTDSEDLRCLREGLLGLLAHTREDLLSRLPVGTGTAQRPQTLGSRVDRLRGLGNAVVPQVVEHIGRLILDAAA